MRGTRSRVREPTKRTNGRTKDSPDGESPVQSTFSHLRGSQQASGATGDRLRLVRLVLPSQSGSFRAKVGPKRGPCRELVVSES